MDFMRKYLLSLALLCGLATGAWSAADLGNTAIISPTDASNGSGTCPSWLGSAAPSTLDDAGRCLQGAIAREWENRSFAITSTGSANSYVVSYTVAPAAYRTGQVYSFITNFTVSGSATVNINSLGAKTIKKDVAGTLTALSSGDMASGQFVMLAYNGTDMIWVNWQGSASSVPSLASTTEVLTGTDAAKTTTPDAIAALWEAGSDITDGAAITIGEGGYFNLITSTTAITSFSITTDKAGRTFRVRFNTARTLTYNATSLIIPGAANITTAQGDIAQIRSLGGGNVVVDWYTKANGQPVIAASSMEILAVGTTVGSGATLTVGSGTITKAYSQIKIILDGISHDGGGSETFTVEITGNNGSGYGAAITFTAAVAGASSTDATIVIDNAATTSGSRAVTTFNTSLQTSTVQSITTGYINGFRLDISANSFDAGTYTLIGIL